MIGLMQIMIYLFCVYLIYKGFEIFQIAFVAPKENNSRPLALGIGILAIIFAIVISFFAVTITDGMAEKIGDNMRNIGK